MLHQDKKRWKQVKHYWFDIVQPIRPHVLGENSLQSVVKNHNLIFYVTGKVENFHGMNCFFLHCHPISYFIIHVCNQKTDKHSEMTKSWNFQTSAYQRLKSNFRVLDLIPIFFRTDVLHQDKKRWKQVKIDLMTANQGVKHFLCDRKSWKFMK